MDPTTSTQESEVNSTSQVIPQENNKRLFSPKLIIIIIFIFLLLIITGVLFLLRVNKDGQIESKQSSITPIIDSEFVKSSAKEIAEYINSQRRDDGFYNYLAHPDDSCFIEDGNRKCLFDSKNMFETTNAWTALGYFAAYEILGDKKYLESAKVDLRKLDEWCEKDRVKCSWVLVQPAIIYESTKDTEIRDFLTKQTEVLIKLPPTSNSMLSAVEARTLFKLAKILDKKELVTEGIKRLEYATNNLYAKENYLVKGADGFSAASCWIALAGSENLMDGSGLNKKSIQNINLFMDNARIDVNFDKINASVFLQPCIETYYRLGIVSKDNVNKIKGDLLFKMFLDKYYDSAVSKKIYGEGGILSYWRPSEKIKGQITMTDTSYSLYLLSLVK